MAVATPNRAHRCLEAVRELILAGAGRATFGFDEDQRPGRHAAAIEHPQAVFDALLRRLLQLEPCRTIVQLGHGGDGTRERALLCLADRVVTIADPDEATPAAIDVLLIDRDRGYDDVAACWRALAPSVRVGGLIAIVDRAQERVDVARPDDVDRFAFDLQERFLRPRGRALERLGRGHAIHLYQRCEGDDERSFVPACVASNRSSWRRVDGEAGEFSVFTDSKQWLAVAGRPVAYRDRDRARHAYELVLAAPDEGQLRAAVRQWPVLEGLGCDALRCLASGEFDGLEGLRTHLLELDDRFEGWLEQALLAQPHGRRLLRTAGALWCLRGNRDLGAALLERLLDDDLTDSELVAALAQVHLALRHDEGAARQLLDCVRRRVETRRRQQLCLASAPAHPLWTQPELLGVARSVLWIGPGGDAGAAFAGELGLRLTWLPHGQPVSPGLADPVLTCWLSDACAERQRWRDPSTGQVTLRPFTAAFAGRSGTPVLEPMAPCATTTLDRIVAEGGLDPADAEVLVLDLPGEEAAVLRGGEQLLVNVRTLCVAMHHHAAYADTGPHHELVRWLGDRGFAFVGSDPTPLGHRVIGFFQRVES